MLQKAEIPESVGSLSLEIIRTQWNKALGSLIYLNQFSTGGWNTGTLETPLNLKPSVTDLQLCLSVLGIHEFFLTAHA